MKIGDIYIYDYNNTSSIVQGIRPVVVIGIDLDQIEIVPISTFINFRFKWRIITNINVLNKIQQVSILCDFAQKVKASDLNKNLGYLDEKILKSVIDTVELYKTLTISKIDKPNDQNVESNIIITNQDLFNEIMDISIKIDRSNSQKAKWIERGIGFVFGIVASLIASIIYTFF